MMSAAGGVMAPGCRARRPVSSTHPPPMADASVRSGYPIRSSRPCWLRPVPRPTPVTLRWWRCSRRLDCKSSRPPKPTSTTGARNTAAEPSTFDRCPYGADDRCHSRQGHRPRHRWPDNWVNRDQRLQNPHASAPHHQPPAPTRNPMSSSQFRTLTKLELSRSGHVHGRDVR